MDSEHAMFNPTASKKAKLRGICSKYVHTMFTQLIPAETLDESLEEMGVQKPADPVLTVQKPADPVLKVKELDADFWCLGRAQERT